MKFTTIELEKMNDRHRAAFINGILGPKSVHLVGTTNNLGQDNLSIVSSCFHLGANPSLVGMIIRPDTAKRHTLENILEQKYYSLNSVSTSYYKKAHQCSARYDREVSEFDASNIKRQFYEGQKTPFVLDAHIQLGLKFKQEIRIELNGAIIVIGEIDFINITDDNIKNGIVDITSMNLASVQGLDTYFQIGRKLSRLSYAKPDKSLEELD